MATGQVGNAGVDLEKELSCSICTDILFQPLTLLDCLHTFCGSCLKEWFSWQATASQSRRTHTSPYTCPSCRAPVRAARPNANVTTLLDMYLAANPGKGKSEQEKDEMRRNCKPGDDVIPPIEREDSEDDSDQERLLSEARELSIADLDPAVQANRRAARRDHRDRAGRRRQAEDAERRQNAVEHNVSHQPSLRSLLGATGESSAEVQEEILASILSSGVLDGVDIDNLTAEQEEELTERIAEAYRRRHPRPARHGRHRSNDHRSSSGTSPGHRREPQEAAQTPPRSRATSSRPHLIEQWTQDFSQTARRSTEPNEQRPGSSQSREAVANRPTHRSTIDSGMTATSHSDSTQARRTVPETRRDTDPQPQTYIPYSRSVAEATEITPPRRTMTGDLEVVESPPPQELSTPQSALISSSAAPIVNCDRCSRPSIQYQLHYHCYVCQNGSFNLCRQCYRAGQGCLHWFGFGYAAYARWQRNGPAGARSATDERPHVLAQRRYRKTQAANSDTLQEGAFCEQCFEFADKRYWHCNTCFEGAWGFCSTCVQKGRHCTHPLLPVEHKHNAEQPAALPNLPSGQYQQAAVSSKCTICALTIPTTQARYHCERCNDGDYEICLESYLQLRATGKISSLDGNDGWRRCPRGHPLSLIAWQTSAEGTLQRVTISGPVGGWKAKTDQLSAAARHAPPTQAYVNQHGSRCQAYWSWFPADGVDDELAFPRLAEITEASKVNEDYYVGVYAGRRGLFPANHVSEIR